MLVEWPRVSRAASVVGAVRRRDMRVLALEEEDELGSSSETLRGAQAVSTYRISKTFHPGYVAAVDVCNVTVDCGENCKGKPDSNHVSSKRS